MLFRSTVKMTSMDPNNIVFVTAGGREIHTSLGLIKKNEEFYTILVRTRSRYAPMRASEVVHILDHTITKGGIIKARRETQKYAEEVEQWNKVYKYNVKARMLNQGIVEIINGKAEYTDPGGVVDARIPKIVERIGGAGRMGFMSSRNTLTTCVILAPIRKIPKACFAYTENLKSVKFNPEVNDIADLAFTYSGIEEIVIPKSVNRLGKYVFRNSKLKAITFEGVVKYIGEHTFSECKNLESVRLPSGIDTIQAATFYGCRSLKYVFIPKSVKNVHQSAFYTACAPGCIIKAPEHLRGKIEANARIEYY